MNSYPEGSLITGTGQFRGSLSADLRSTGGYINHIGIGGFPFEFRFVKKSAGTFLIHIPDSWKKRILLTGQCRDGFLFNQHVHGINLKFLDRGSADVLGPITRQYIQGFDLVLSQAAFFDGRLYKIDKTCLSLCFRSHQYDIFLYRGCHSLCFDGWCGYAVWSVYRKNGVKNFPAGIDVYGNGLAALCAVDIGVQISFTFFLRIQFTIGNSNFF